MAQRLWTASPVRLAAMKMLTTWRNTGKNREEVMLGKLAKALDAVSLEDVATEVRAKTTREL